MKSIFFVIFLFIFNFVNSQVIRIKLYETLEFMNYDTLGVLSAVSKITDPFNVKKVNCEYVIDLTNKTDMFFRDGVLESEANISFINEGTLFIINFLYDDFDVGVVINTDIKNETFFWFSKSGDFYDISKATNFEFIKSQ